MQPIQTSWAIGADLLPRCWRSVVRYMYCRSPSRPHGRLGPTSLAIGRTQWIAKQQLDRQGTKCFWRGPVGQKKPAQRHEARNLAS
eukprot:COSAG01_NODE_5001_length_4553_cov_26.581275_7_plen_86_part_00